MRIITASAVGIAAAAFTAFAPANAAVAPTFSPSVAVELAGYSTLTGVVTGSDLYQNVGYYGHRGSFHRSRGFHRSSGFHRSRGFHRGSRYYGHSRHGFRGRSVHGHRIGHRHGFHNDGFHKGKIVKRTGHGGHSKVIIKKGY